MLKCFLKNRFKKIIKFTQQYKWQKTISDSIQVTVCFVSIKAVENWIHTQLLIQSAFNPSFLYVTHQIIPFWQLQSCSCLLKSEPLLSKQTESSCYCFDTEQEAF